MRLIVLGSSSAGNGYILNGETRALIIEAGISFRKVKEKLNFDIQKIDGLIASHGHGDHLGKVIEYLKAGVRCYTSQETIEESGIKHHNLIPLKSKTKYQIGEFQVMPFPVVHDTALPFGFLVKHPEMGLLMFVTDSAYVPFKFPGLNHCLIEANFSQEIIDNRTMDDRLHPAQRIRTMKSHMSIEQCSAVLRANDLTKVKNIVLLHLSDGNSDARAFKSIIEQQTGKRVTIADKGVEVDLNLEEF